MTNARPPSGLSWIRILELILIVAMFSAGAYFYSALPDRIPSHWNAAGVVDGYMDKAFGTWFTPGIALLMAVFLPLVAKLDPKKDNYEKFGRTWQMIQLVMVAFFAYVYALQLYASLHAGWALFSNYLMAGLGLMFAVLGNYFGKVRHNYFVGIRTPWTLANEDVWNRTHRLAGKLWVAMGLVVFAWAVFSRQFQLVGFFILLGIAVVVPIVYSYVAYRSKQRS